MTGREDGDAPFVKLMLLQLLLESSFESAGALHGRSCRPQGSGKLLCLSAMGAAPAGNSVEPSSVLEKACRLSCTASMSSARLPKSP